jgi:hypothetical protein
LKFYINFDRIYDIFSPEKYLPASSVLALESPKFQEEQAGKERKALVCTY